MHLLLLIASIISTYLPRRTTTVLARQARPTCWNHLYATPALAFITHLSGIQPTSQCSFLVSFLVGRSNARKI